MPITDPVLVGPFDNLIWDRARTRRVFDFDYLFEAYKPAAKRVYGYYVLTVIADGRFVGRVDLRRDPETLTVLKAHPEPQEDPGRFHDALTSATQRLQQQLQNP